ncbi:MAG: phosphoribosylamine--glycine ligase, partial [Proteobacteria bacterium]
PTANYNSFNNPQAALDYLRTVSPTAASPQVLKADGLASGKGVFICEDFPQAEQALKEIFTDLKGGQVVIEEFLKGQEVSFIVATDGERIVPLAPSHDYKRIFENDRGPNTGGMGTVSPSPRLSGDMEKGLSELVIEPVLREMRRRGMPFQGFLYAGLMIGYGGEVNVLEYNARLGDPECQVIMRRMESDLLEILLNLSSSGEQLPEVKWTPEHAVCVVLAAHGYPASPRAGDEINGIELAEQLSDCVVFHAGTKIDRQRLVTAGGRVMSVTATGPNIESARNKAYRAASLIQFAGCQLRRDIGLS